MGKTAYDRACLAVVAITPHTHYDSNCSREEGNADITLRPQRADLQTVRSVGGFLDRAATHFSNTGVDPDNFVNTRLFDDMAPFHFQIEAASHHSVWGVEALKTGAFTPPALVGTAYNILRSRGVPLGKRDYEGRLRTSSF
jgi:hypothetical protein